MCRVRPTHVLFRRRARLTAVVASFAWVLSGGADCTGEAEINRNEPVQPPREKPPNPYEHSPSRFGSVPLHAGFSPDPRVVSGTAIGEVPARSLHRKCRGWVSRVPDYLLQAETAFFQLYVLGRSRSDVVVVARKPDGSVVCNDNRPGTKDPMIHDDFPIGTTQFWVGVKEEGESAPYRLGFSEVMWRSSSIRLPDD